MSTKLSHKPLRSQPYPFSRKKAAAGKKGWEACIKAKGSQFWKARLAKATAARAEKARSGAYRQGGPSPRFAFSVTPEQREAIDRLSREAGISASALVRACITRAWPQVVKSHKNARRDKEALKRFSDRVTRDSLKQWGEE